ncbi:carbohydrate kinase family protein [Salinibacter grassmerensis]|uniref:carbohydrate kinase family protein n=1 Tax=Salinibacter grassmerensis TaxID=3040353 RepID=UPI0021E8A6BE|nr:carbohydrate kinase [Salinibacter grassmerensis]
MSDTILCVGEVLWDALPDGLFLGGAPFNVASHLRALDQEVVFVSRVGDDRLGHETLRRMQARGLETRLMQIDDSLPTGFVQVQLEEAGGPDYEILEPAAWDAITLSDPVQEQARHADALVYGSLAQRSASSRRTIQHLCEPDLLRVFDVNLRPPFVDPAVVEQSLELADVVKCNDDEFRRLQDWFALPDVLDAATAELAASVGCSAVCVTAGPEGAWLWMRGTCTHHPGYPVDVHDTVGAGDAFLAALLTGLLRGESAPTLLEHAHRLGAFVAARPGALPSCPADTFSELSRLPLNA